MSFELEELWESMKEHKYENIVVEIKQSLDDSFSHNSNMMNEVLGVVAKTMHAEAGSLWLYLDGSSVIVPKAVYGGKPLYGITLHAGEGIVGKVITSGEPAIVSDVNKENGYNQSVDQKTGFKTQSLICVPLKRSDGTSFGCIQLINKLDKTDFDNKDLKFAQKLAEVAQIYFEEYNPKEFKNRKALSVSLKTVLYAKTEDEVVAILEDIADFQDLGKLEKKDFLLNILNARAIIMHNKTHI